MFYTGKTLVRSFDYNNIRSNRQTFKTEIINGRTYYKEGTLTATAVVGDLYKVEGPSDEPFNYVMLIGVARQHPCDVKIDAEVGTELAAINAKTNPVITLKFQHKVGWDTFRNIAETYINSLPQQFIKTTQEIKASGVNKDKYIR